MESLHDLEVLIGSGKRLIVVETEREGCFIEGFHKMANRSTKAYFQWTITRGLLRLAAGYEPQVMNKDMNHLFAQIQSSKPEGVYVLIDFHPYMTDPIAVRHIKDVILNSPQHTLILLSQKIELPEELETLATRFSLPLPTERELKKMVKGLASDYLTRQQKKLKAPEKGILKRLVESLCGLSVEDARRLARHAIYNDGIIDQADLDHIAKEKFKLLDGNQVLNFHLDYEQLSNIAGFNHLKEWLTLRRRVFLGEVDLPGDDIPKGLLLLGVQGCGKSMAAKAVAGSWQLPLLHFDFGVLYSRWMGETEENLRSALKSAEFMSPCVLWIDEIEKGLSAVSGSDDTSKRLLGTFLTWLAENKSQVFIVATANDVSALPPELMRKGRFDEVFFVDLPNPEERQAIFEIHLKRRKLEHTTIDLERIAEHTEGFSGAELEQLIVSAVYQSHADNRNISTEQLLHLADSTRPLSKLMHEKIEGLRQWAQGRAIKV